MASPPFLTVSALGAFQLLRDGKPVPKFKYLDARELLVFLLLHSTSGHGKSKQEIGAALWGDLSDAQLNARFKARLNDVRRVLGGRDWILFADETYAFNPARDVTFDVPTFVQACDDADKQPRTGTHENPRTALQNALQLYRGDFLQDYHTRRRRDLSGEREWYLQVREQLQAKYRSVLERLTELELHAGQSDAAIELLRKRVALDEYDDRAHADLIRTLSLQGKRSQALRHYHDLLKHRADTPPTPELTILFEKIKRNEPLEKATPTPAQPAAPSTFSDPAKLPPPFQVPADLPRFVGRETQFDILRNELLRAQGSNLQSRISNLESPVSSLESPISNLQSPVSSLQSPISDLQSFDSAQDESLISNLQSPISNLCIVGMGGIGKTSLAIHAAYRLRDRFPDGVLWGNLRESEPLAVLASWERAYGCDFSGLPDLNARAASLRSMLHDKQVLVILDDVVDAAQARPLLLNGPHTRTVFTSRSAEIATALDALLIEMPVLEADESADLLTRIVGRTRVAGQEAYAHEICDLLGHLPLALDITARRLVSRPHWTLRDMADRLRAQIQRLDELQLADRAVRATFALSWDALTDPQKHVLAQVGAFQARSFTAAALAYVAEIPEPAARDLLDGLVSLSLLSFETNTRYRQHPLLADFSLEKLQEPVIGDRESVIRNQLSVSSIPPSAPSHPPSEIENQQSEIQNQQSKIKNQKSSLSRLSQYYLSFATAHRREYLALEDEWDNLNVGIEIAYAQEAWQAVIDYGDVLTDAWFARGRFTDARRNYPFVMRAGRELEEQDPYIAATLNWGKACIDQGDYAEAEEHLQNGLQTSREVNDEYGIASALLLLGRIAVQRSEYKRAQEYLQYSQHLREKLGDRAGVAETLHLQARIRFQFHDYEGTVQFGHAALAILHELPAGHDLIVTYRLLATTASYQHQEKLAREYVNKALALCDKLQNFGEYAAVLYELALMGQQTGQLDVASEQAESSLKLMQQIGDRKTQAYLHKLLSRIALERGQYPLASQEAKTTLELLQDFQDIMTIASVFLLLGDIEKATDQIESAKAYWTEAINVSTPYNHPIAKIARERLEEL